MDRRIDELEDFKTRVNLTEFAVSMGYALDRKASSRNSAVMANDAGDKIVIAIGADGHWVYFSVRDANDHGSIIDFVQRRRGGTLGQVRQILRPWVGSSSPTAPPLPRPHPSMFVGRLEPVPRDLVMVRARFEAMNAIDTANPYLTVERRIPPTLLALSMFADRVRTDDRGNVIFPHFNRDGLCGYEIKNRGFTGFASGGIKGLWASRPTQEDRCLVIAETAIDALSYAAIRGVDRTRFVSIAGQMNPEQPILIRSAIEKLPARGCVVSAMDRDDAGDALTARIQQVLEETTRGDLAFNDDRPSTRNADWNDVLRLPPFSSESPNPAR